MKELLMIAYYYPPLGGIGALRPLHFAKYLPEFGWNTTVLTVLNDISYPRDDSLVKNIPKTQRIYRAYRYPVFDTFRRIARGPLRRLPLWYSFLDSQFDWVPAATRMGRQIAKNHKIDAMFATAPPYSTIRVAKSVKEDTGLPCVADLRDQFVTNDSIVWPSSAHKRFYSIYERKLLSSMDELVVANQVYTEDLDRIHGASHPNATWIPNGYDPSNFAEQMPGPPSDRYVLGHFGSIYGRISPMPFFESLAQAMTERPGMRVEDSVMTLVLTLSEATTCSASSAMMRVSI